MYNFSFKILHSDLLQASPVGGTPGVVVVVVVVVVDGVGVGEVGVGGVTVERPGTGLQVKWVVMS